MSATEQLPPLREDTHGVIPYTMRDVETTLAALCEVDPEELTPELRAEFERDLAEAIRKAPEKRERVAIKLFDLGQRAAIKRAAAKAHLDRARELEASAAKYEDDAERLKNYVLDVMRELPQPKRGPRILEGTSATFKAAKVPDSVEVFNETLLPEEFRTAIVTLSLSAYRELASELTRLHVPAPVWGRVDKKEIKAALTEALPCEKCLGAKTYIGSACPACSGDGTRHIPGARLATGKLRLVVE